MIVGLELFFPKFLFQFLLKYSQAWLQQFHGRWGPNASHQTFNQFCESGTVALHCANDDHDYVSAWVQFSSMGNSIVDFLGAVDFFHGTGSNFDRQEFGHFVTNVEWGVEDDVPTGSCDQKLWCVF